MQSASDNVLIPCICMFKFKDFRECCCVPAQPGLRTLACGLRTSLYESIHVINQY